MKFHGPWRATFIKFYDLAVNCFCSQTWSKVGWVFSNFSSKVHNKYLYFFGLLDRLYIFWDHKFSLQVTWNKILGSRGTLHFEAFFLEQTAFGPIRPHVVLRLPQFQSTEKNTVNENSKFHLSRSLNSRVISDASELSISFSYRVSLIKYLDFCTTFMMFHDGDCRYIPGSSYHGLVHCVTYIVLKQGYRSQLSSQCYLLSNRRMDKNTVVIYIKKEVINDTVNCVMKERETSALSPLKHD